MTALQETIALSAAQVNLLEQARSGADSQTWIEPKGLTGPERGAATLAWIHAASHVRSIRAGKEFLARKELQWWGEMVTYYAKQGVSVAWMVMLFEEIKRRVK